MTDASTAYLLAVGGVSIFAGIVAAISGFGIGSLLTPLLALQVDTRVAVAVVAIPHVVGTALRFWLLRAHVDRALLRDFGIASAIGGLAGAALHGRMSSRALTLVFAILLLSTAAAELTGWMRRVEWGRGAGLVAGAISGLFGGLVGNQGSVRTAGLLAYRVSPTAFVATATAVALIVDAVRLPFYIASHGRSIAALLPVLVIASAGVLIGTLIGFRIVSRMSEWAFRRSVAVLLLLLGVLMLTQAGGSAS